MSSFRSVLVTVLVLFSTAVAQAAPQADALDRLRAASGAGIEARVSDRTGVPNFVRAERGQVLYADSAAQSPESRARAFLAKHGDVIGMNDAERVAVEPRDARRIAANSILTDGSRLHLRRVDRDDLGETHVRMSQSYRGVPVFGAEVVVHMNERGITGVNGAFVPDVHVPVEPRLDALDAADILLSRAIKSGTEPPVVHRSELIIYRIGLLEGFKGNSVLAWMLDIETNEKAERVILDATFGTELLRYALHPDALYRKIYTPSEAESDLRRKEGDAPSFVPPIDNLYDFAGQVYHFFLKAFGRDSYDGAGATMRSVYLVNNLCPNAYWNSSTTNYCPGFDADDIVAHEWGHAYTEYTHNLIYAYQSGALNESYSDIWGETVDLNNGRDTLVGGTNNTAPHPAGQRWLIGEDLVGPAHNELLTRDMWDPDRLGSPGKVTSANYACGTGDYGGVHTNSGVPNHAFTMLVDGKTYNGQTVQKIGFTKAINIYFRAQTAYQTPTSSFADHDQAMRASCADLIGKPLRNFMTGLASTDVITASDCAQVAKAMVAVEMSTPPDQCAYQPQLAPNAAPKCVRYETLFADDFETGLDGWTLDRRGPRDFNWVVSADLPDGRGGSAAFAEDPLTGTCGQAGTAFTMTSPAIVVPAVGADERVTVRFDHYIATEQEWDGGNVKISVNGGPFTLVPQSAYAFNAPSRTLLDAVDGTGAPQNTNPLASEIAFTGTDGGKNAGSWGTSMIDLTALAAAGDSVRIQFDNGFDGCAGVTGWYVDNFSVYRCPAADLRAPEQNAIGDDSYPDQSDGTDRDGRYTISWSYPAEGEPACGFRVEEARVIAAAPFTDDAEELLVAGANSRWSGAATWHTRPHPGTGSMGYAVLYADNVTSSLAMKNGFTIPEGAGAVLTFESVEDVEDGFDYVYVDVSTNGGSTWHQIFVASGVFSGTRMVNLSQFEGKTILVRFRIAADIVYSFPQYQGWFVDDIAIRTTDKFVAIGTVGGDVTSYNVTLRGDGLYAYRVVGLFGECGTDPNVGPASNVTQMAVQLAPTAAPTASFTAAPNPAAVNTAVTFNGSASADNDTVGAGSGIASYHWSFGDGGTASSATATHTYTAEGTYRVTLTVTDNDGESASSEQLVQVFTPQTSGQAVGAGNIGTQPDKASFGFDVTLEGTATSGELTYSDRAANVKVHSTSITSYTRNGSSVRFTGTCKVNKVSGFTFTVEVTDGSPDSFSITLSSGYSRAGTLTGGDVTIR